jgi:DNA-binding MarR family transcriptional regulator
MAVAKRAQRADPGPDAADIDFGRLDTYVGFHLRMAQTASFQAFAREAGEIDLSPGRYAILSLIGDNPGISQTALSRANARDKSSLTPALDDLERRGLVLRERVATNRRSYALTLTPAGEQMRRRLDECAERHERNIDRILGVRDREKFIRLLRKLTAELGGAEERGV